MTDQQAAAPLVLTCGKCGCSRQVRTQTALQEDPDPAAKTRYTYLKTVCPACGNETEFLVFLEPGWTVQDGDQQEIACPCGGTRFQDAERDTPTERIERGTLVGYHELTCVACGRESIVFTFSGSDVLPDLERQSLLSGRAP
jgi:ribosomal protein S27E